MIACDAPNCPIEWFHFSCVCITNEPDSDEEWYCDECKSKLKLNKYNKLCYTCMYNDHHELVSLSHYCN